MNTNMWSMPQIVVCPITLPLIGMGGFAEGSAPYFSLRSNLKAEWLQKYPSYKANDSTGITYKYI